jgi:hypothetical protein
MQMTATRALLAAIALLAAACGGGSEAGAAGDASVSIAQPADGAQVALPLKLELSSGVELGSPETGKHHVHVFYDGNEDDYEVVNGTSYLVRELPGGEHTIHASLRNADHSAAGAEDSVTVTVTGGAESTGGEGEEPDEGDDGNGGYGY